MPSLLPGAEPFYFHGNDTGVLLIHGFTGAPQEMRPLGEDLAARGYTVLGLRLPGHGTTPDDMLHVQAQDWQNAASDGYHLLQAQCARVVVMGLSMGGALALGLAAQYLVAAVVALSTPSQPSYAHMNWRSRYAHWLGRFIRYVPKPPSPPNAPPPELKHVAYPTYPILAVTQLRRVMLAGVEALPRITAPLFVAHSGDDLTVPLENGPYIAAHTQSTRVETLWLTHSGHVITEGPERHELFESLHQFIQK